MSQFPRYTSKSRGKIQFDKSATTKSIRFASRESATQVAIEITRRPRRRVVQQTLPECIDKHLTGILRWFDKKDL